MIPDSHRIWSIYRDFRVLKLQANGDQKNEIEAMKKIYRSRLSIPHAQLDQTFSDYSSFVTAYDNENYEDELIAGNKIYSQTQKALQYRESWEIRVSNEKTLQAYAEYIQWEIRRPKKFQNRLLVTALYERAIHLDPHVVEVWDDYILYMHAQYDVDTVNKIVARAVKACPGSGVLWAHMLRVSAGQDEEKMWDLHETIEMNLFLKPDSYYSEWKPMYVAWLAYIYELHKYSQDLDPLMDACAIGLATAERYHDESSTFDLEMLIVNIYTQHDFIDKSRTAWQNVSKYHGKESEFWIRWYLWEQANGTEESALTLLNIPMSRNNIDWPERILEYYLEHVTLHGSAYSTMSAMAQCRRKMKAVQEKRLEDYTRNQVQQDQAVDQAEASNDVRDERSAKRTRDEIDDNELEPKPRKKPTRDREHTSVLVSNLSPTTTNDSVAAFFADCGNMKDVVVHKFNDEVIATVEFEDVQAMLSALTRDMKQLDGREVHVSSGDSTTVWVTNFPSSETEDSLRQMFTKYGKILSIRFPSLKFNTMRRFCYIQFSNANEAQRASAELDGKDLGQKESLVVKISDPSKKQSRKGALVEGREVIVKGIDFVHVGELDLRSAFSAYGEIEKIKLPKKTSAKDRLHDGYGFITFTSPESAQASLELNGKQLGPRVLQVSICDTKPKTTTKVVLNNGESKDFRSKTLIVTNVSDTINDTVLRDMFSKFGPLHKLVLKPDVESAIVEFQEVPVSTFKQLIIGYV